MVQIVQAVKAAKDIAKSYKSDVYTFGSLIHNEQVTEDLKHHGVYPLEPDISSVKEKKDPIVRATDRVREKLRYGRVYCPAQIKCLVYIADFRDGGVKINTEYKKRMFGLQVLFHEQNAI